MFNDPLHWFPNALISNVFAVLVLGLFLLDATLQFRGVGSQPGLPDSGPTPDRC